MGGLHGIGHRLAPVGVGHGQTSCVLLPSVLKFNLKHGDNGIKGRQRKLLDVLWGKRAIADLLHKNGYDKVTELGDVIGAIVQRLDLPRTLKDVGIGKDKFENFANNSLKDPWLSTNVVPLTKSEQVLEILEMLNKTWSIEDRSSFITQMCLFFR